MNRLPPPPNGSPEEIQAWNDMMETMVTFIRASTNLMNTITTKVKNRPPAVSGGQSNLSDLMGGCEPECEACRPKPPCGTCAQKMPEARWGFDFNIGGLGFEIGGGKKPKEDPIPNLSDVKLPSRTPPPASAAAKAPPPEPSTAAVALPEPIVEVEEPEPIVEVKEPEPSGIEESGPPKEEEEKPVEVEETGAAETEVADSEPAEVAGTTETNDATADETETPTPAVAGSTPAVAPSAPGIVSSAPGVAPSAPGLAPSAPGLAPSAPGLAPSAPGLAPSAPGLAPSAPGLAPSSAGVAPSSAGVAPSGQMAATPPGIKCTCSAIRAQKLAAEKQSRCACKRKTQQAQPRAIQEEEPIKERVEEEPVKEEVEIVCGCGPTDGNREAMVQEMMQKLATAQQEIAKLQEEMARLQRMDASKRIGPHGGPNPAALYKEIMKDTDGGYSQRNLPQARQRAYQPNVAESTGAGYMPSGGVCPPCNDSSGRSGYGRMQVCVPCEESAGRPSPGSYGPSPDMSRPMMRQMPNQAMTGRSGPTSFQQGCPPSCRRLGVQRSAAPSSMEASYGRTMTNYDSPDPNYWSRLAEHGGSTSTPLTPRQQIVVCSALKSTNPEKRLPRENY